MIYLYKLCFEFDCRHYFSSGLASALSTSSFRLSSPSYNCKNALIFHVSTFASEARKKNVTRSESWKVYSVKFSCDYFLSSKQKNTRQEFLNMVILVKFIKVFIEFGKILYKKSNHMPKKSNQRVFIYRHVRDLKN